MNHSAEKLIQEWLKTETEEELPGHGKPLELDEYFRWPADKRQAYALLKNAGCVPVEVEHLQQIDRLEDELKRCDDPARRVALMRQREEQQVSLNLRLEQARRQRRS